MPDVLGPMRDYLVTAGVVREPSVAAPGNNPNLCPLWIEPALGTPAPNEMPPGGNAIQKGPTAVAAAYLSGGFPPGPYESTWRLPTVDVRLRTKDAPTAKSIEQAMSAALIDKRDFMLGGLYCIECLMWRALAPLGSDNQSFDWTVSYRFQVLAP
jgi:hypothetical protein